MPSKAEKEPTMTTLSLEAQLAALKAENEALKAAKGAPRKMTIKVGEKGGLCVYGLGRFPVSLYRGQWERLIAFIPEVSDFIAANADKLTVKE
jgi:hypothetical protein